MPRQTLKQRPDGRYACKYKGKFFYGATQTEALAAREEYKRQEKSGLRPGAALEKSNANGGGGGMRLDRWLVTLGLGSRSEVQRLIRSGAVCVEGNCVRDPSADFPTEITPLAVGGKAVDGRLVRHVMLHKPAGLLTAARDKKQPTVMELLPPAYGAMGCMPVGRLDKDTTGLLLLTTDGELNHRLLDGVHVGRFYQALTAWMGSL